MAVQLNLFRTYPEGFLIHDKTHLLIYFPVTNSPTISSPDLTPLENCKLLFVDEIFACEKAGTQLTAEDLANNPTASPVKSKDTIKALNFWAL